MESGCLLQAAFVLFWLILSKAQDVTRPSLSCFRSITADGKTRITFLHQDTAGERSVFLTVWSENMTLVKCQRFTSVRSAEGYHALCSNYKTWDKEVTQMFNFSMVLTSEAPCLRVSSEEPEFVKSINEDGPFGKVRKKRAWILPGTLWCGSGSKAVGYEELGMFEGADKCCREHDHCLHIIPAFTVNYGVFNPNFFTVSLCDCDQRFRQCLMDTNDSVSHMVGYSFFNILQIPCFELKLLKRCTEMYWWGMCKRAKKAPYAVFKKPQPYNRTNDTTKDQHSDSNDLASSERLNSTERSTIKLPRKSPKTKSGCGQKEPPRGDTFHRKRIKGKGCQRDQKSSGITPSEIPSVSRTKTAKQSKKTGPIKNNLPNSNERRAGKMKTFRDSLFLFVQRNLNTSTVAPINHLKMPSATPSMIPPHTQRSEGQLPPTPKVIGSHQNVTDHIHICGSNLTDMDNTHLDCKNNLEPKFVPNATAATLTRTTKLNQQSSHESLHLKFFTDIPNQDSSPTFQTSVTLITQTPKPRTKGFLYKDDMSKKRMDFYLLRNKTRQNQPARSIVQNNQTERNQDSVLDSMTGYLSHCQTLKHLDDCKFKISPLETKYSLQNIESKTAYHCDCTSRLADEIEEFKHSSILWYLLENFVSQQCFTLSKEKKCHHKKRCFHGSSKASDLHRAFKKMKEKNATMMKISSSHKERRLPLRLYKRCLRLEREADIMAKLK